MGDERMNMSPPAHDYILAYGQMYADKTVKTILAKSDIDISDISVLSTIYHNPVNRTYAYCIGLIHRSFHNFLEKAAHFHQENPESDTYQTISMCETHMSRCLFGVESVFNCSFDINRLVKKLTSYEIRILDDFTQRYVETRGLFIKAAKKGVRVTSPYHAWVQRVKMNDDFTCQRCGTTEELESHHIIPVSRAPELATDLNNGITLCEKCHKLYHSSRNESQCRAETLNQFIKFYKKAVNAS